MGEGGKMAKGGWLPNHASGVRNGFYAEGKLNQEEKKKKRARIMVRTPDEARLQNLRGENQRLAEIFSRLGYRGNQTPAHTHGRGGGEKTKKNGRV